MPVQNIEDVKSIISVLRKQYHDARHICYAYMLGPDRNDYRANDDGEPSGTAGRPILGQINSRELTYVLVVVVRYFGGVLLGTGGLVTAYKESASNALDSALILEKAVEYNYKIMFDYLMMNEVMKLIKESDATITNQVFENECVIFCSVSVHHAGMLKTKLKKMKNVDIILQ